MQNCRAEIGTLEQTATGASHAGAFKGTAPITSASGRISSAGAAIAREPKRGADIYEQVSDGAFLRSQWQQASLAC